MKMSGGLSFGGHAAWEHVRITCEQRPLLLALLVVASAISPFLGSFLAEWTGVFVGLGVSVFTFVGGYYAITRVREVTKGGS